MKLLLEVFQVQIDASNLKGPYNVRMGTFEILHCKVQDFAHWNIYKVQNKLSKCGTIYCTDAYSKCAMCNDLHVFMCKTMFLKKKKFKSLGATNTANCKIFHT